MKIAVFDKEETKLKYSKLLDEYVKAREAVEWLLENEGSVDFHGIAYWAQVFEDKKKQIKELV